MVLLLILAAVALVLVALAMWLTALAILSPPRMTDGKAMYVLKRLSPADLGMRFEETPFEVRDTRDRNRALKLAAWWIPHPAGGDKTVILIHGNSDAKVGAIAWAPTWQKLGYHILAIDLRAHGESTGRFTTAGVLERHDLSQVIDQLRAARPRQTEQLVLFGASMGAMVALACADLRDDIDAIVLDCPFANFAHAVATHAALIQSPLQWLVPLTLRVGGWMAGADLSELQPLEMLTRVRCPVMIIQSGDDRFVPPDDVKAISRVMQARPESLGGSEVWLVPDVAHLQALPNDPDAYLLQLDKFLSQIGSKQLPPTATLP